MSYANTICPCGGTKLPNTMLCDECEKHVAGSYDRIRMDDPKARYVERRLSAIRVLAVIHNRRKEGT